MVGLWYALLGLSLAEQEPLFRLVGLYDASGVMATSKKVEQRYLWKPSTQMMDSCGPTKSPDALGIFEAESVANQMSPTLAIVLEYTGEPQYQSVDGQPCSQQEDDVCESVSRPPITNTEINIGLGVNQIEYQLQPMVLPRYLAIDINGYIEPDKEDKTTKSAEFFDTTRYQKLIRTQLEIELCLEHKVGRGWMGNDADKLRQAFLLDPPDRERLDRKYFGGQRDPIPALLGPSDACISSEVDMPKDTTASKGRGSMLLTPSDIWGSSLRDCEKNMEEGGKALLREPAKVPLQISENGVRQARSKPAKWQSLQIDVVSQGEEETDVFIDVSLDGEPVEGLQNVALFPEKGSMIDILARVKHTYPRVGTKVDSDRYVVLLIPNWQIAEGLRRMYSRSCVDDTADLLCKCSVKNLSSPFPKGDDLETQLNMLDQRLACKDIDGNICSLSREIATGKEISPAESCLQSMDMGLAMESSGEGVFDAVGWVLQHPKELFIQVKTREKHQEGFDFLAWLSGTKETSGGEQWPNLAGVASGGFLGLQDWGYTVGQLAGRAPIVLPADERVSWDIAAAAQRYKQHSYFILSVFILISMVIAGFRRIADFWTPIPEERAYYWPGRQAENQDQEADGVELEDSGGEAAAE